MNQLGKYSLGIGDRFAQQGTYQMEAIRDAFMMGINITPVWNKSHREHKTVGSRPEDVRKEADASIKEYGWERSYFVDADHIRIDTVDSYISSSDFFTIDVADKIGQPPDPAELEDFLVHHEHLGGELNIHGFPEPVVVTRDNMVEILNKFYSALKEAGRIYKRIKKKKKDKHFAVEISMDEVDEPQTPVELYFILLLIAEFGIPADTIAPKFIGKFNKGIDYEGDVEGFAMEFEKNLLVVRHAVRAFGFPSGLKMSIHTGSDKFSLYPSIRSIIKKYDGGIHLKTAGTTWLEELTGMSEAGETGLELAKSIYFEAVVRYDELTSPYGSVLNIDRSKLPSGKEVKSWDGNMFSSSINHNKSNPDYNPNMRQLLHTAYKIAAEKGDLLLDVIRKNQELIGMKVKHNLLHKHILPLFKD